VNAFTLEDESSFDEDEWLVRKIHLSQKVCLVFGAAKKNPNQKIGHAFVLHERTWLFSKRQKLKKNATKQKFSRTEIDSKRLENN
jgi:hypothetical protein